MYIEGYVHSKEGKGVKIIAKLGSFVNEGQGILMGIAGQKLTQCPAEISSEQFLSKTSKGNDSRQKPDCMHSFTPCQKTSIL